MEHYSKQSERFYVFARLKIRDDTLKIHKDLVKVVGSKGSSQTTIRIWHDLFCSEYKDKKIVNPLSRPKTASNEEKVFAVTEKGRADIHISVREISSKLALSLGAACEILHGNLYMRKLAARWIPHKLTEFKKECRDNIATYPFILSEPNGQKRLTNVVM